jgi:polyisoprenoid-binding protein YceI
MFRIILGLLVFLQPCIALSLDPTIKPKHFKIGKENSYLTFLTVANPGLLSIEGKGGYVEGVIILLEDKVSGTLKVPLSNIDTGMGLRNEHMRSKYLSVEKYPHAKLILDPFIVDDSGAFSGLLTVKKDTKAVRGTYKLEAGQVSAKMSIDVKDFPSIGVPSFLGVSIQDSVTINVGFSLKE